MSEAGRVLAGRYQLTRHLADGGMGEIWTARHLMLDAPVAVKLMNGEGLQRADLRMRFEQEAKAIALLRSPNVVQILDYGTDGDTPFIVMELLEGIDLLAMLQKQPKWPLPEVAALVSQIAKGLGAAHELGLVHRDVKPGNVFLSRNGEEVIAKLLDFGIAKWANAEQQITETNAILGSPFYMSPEQINCESLDGRADLWALGVVAFRLVTGELPFSGRDGLEIAERILLGGRKKVTPPAPHALELERFFGKALSPSRNDRFESASAFADAFILVAGVPGPMNTAASVLRAESDIFATKRFVKTQQPRSSFSGEDSSTIMRPPGSWMVKGPSSTRVDPDQPTSPDARPSLQHRLQADASESTTAPPSPPKGKKTLVDDVENTVTYVMSESESEDDPLTIKAEVYKRDKASQPSAPARPTPAAGAPPRPEDAGPLTLRPPPDKAAVKTSPVAAHAGPSVPPRPGRPGLTPSSPPKPSATVPGSPPSARQVTSRPPPQPQSQHQRMSSPGVIIGAGMQTQEMPATLGPDHGPHAHHDPRHPDAQGHSDDSRRVLDASGISHPAMMTPLPIASTPQPGSLRNSQLPPHVLSMSQGGDARVSSSSLPAHVLETSRVFTAHPGAPLPSGWTAAPPHGNSIPFAAEESVLTLPIRTTGGQAARSAVIASLAVCGAIALIGSLWAAHNMRAPDSSASSSPSIDSARPPPQQPPPTVPPVQTSKAAASVTASAAPSAVPPVMRKPGGMVHAGPLPGSPGSKR